MRVHYFLLGDMRSRPLRRLGANLDDVHTHKRQQNLLLGPPQTLVMLYIQGLHSMFFKPKQRLVLPHKFAFQPQKTYAIICAVGGLSTSMWDLGTSSCVSGFPCKYMTVVNFDIIFWCFSDGRQFSPTQEELHVFHMLVVTLCLNLCFLFSLNLGSKSDRRPCI